MLILVGWVGRGGLYKQVCDSGVFVGNLWAEREERGRGEGEEEGKGEGKVEGGGCGGGGGGRGGGGGDEGIVGIRGAIYV